MYLSLNGVIIPNHGLVWISDIGSTDNTALLCHTNRPASGSRSGGDWYAPDGTRVTLTAVPGFRRNRDPMVVRLLRNNYNNYTPMEGIYDCVIEDSTFTPHAVYVGLYNSGGGKCTIVSKFLSKLDIYCCRQSLCVSWCDLLSGTKLHVYSHLYLHWWTCYHCHLDQRLCHSHRDSEVQCI